MTAELGAAAKRWHVQPEPPDAPAGDWPPLVGRLLALRGVTDAADARAFLGVDGTPALPALERSAGSGAEGAAQTLVLPDLDLAVERLARACRAGERVAVFGDFDVDGITSCALLTEGLRELGAKPAAYLPHRVDEGYGLNAEAVGALAGAGATLLVTADCGTSSVREIALARERGMDAIVLDHHTVPPLLPAAIVVNPKREEGPVDEPAACGIAYHVLIALYEALGRPVDEARLIELAALGTVCDLAPLTGSNRTLVRDGLIALARTERPGLRALIEVAGADPRRIDTETLGFALGPRLNAAGRLAHARLAYDLLVCDDEDDARALAAELDALNRQRRRATEDAFALAEELVAEEGEPPLIMVGHEDFPMGIVGLVASRLVESRRRPAVVYQRGADESRASARSIREFDVTAALRTRPELFVRFGGHRMAAGFTAENEQLPAIKETLLARAEEQLAGLDLTPSIEIDAELPLAELRGDEIRWLARLAPHGIGNPEPAFLSRNVLVVERRAVGADGSHLKLKLKDGAVSWPAIAFRQEGAGIEEGTRADIVYALSADRLSRDALQLRVIDLRAAGGNR